MIRRIIFDFDGTLADTAEGILETEKAMLRQLGLPITSDEQMRAGIGLPLALSLEKGCNLDPGIVPEAVRIYRELFDEVAPRHIVVFEGVKETLSELKRRGIRMAIATSRGSRSLKMILHEHGMEEYFDYTLSADSGIPLKPNPDMVLELIRLMVGDNATLSGGNDMGIGENAPAAASGQGSSSVPAAAPSPGSSSVPAAAPVSPASETLVVGDTTFDIDMGNGALARTVAVTYGNHPREILLTSHPNFIIDSFPDILNLF